MKRVPHGEATSSAEPVDVAELSPSGELQTPELLWAKLEAFERALPDLLETALRRLMDEELRLEPAHVRATVRGLFERAAADHGPFVLRVHPDDRVLLDALPVRCEVQDDPGLSRGGCVLTSPALELDGRVEVRLSRVLQVLKG